MSTTESNPATTRKLSLEDQRQVATRLVERWRMARHEAVGNLAALAEPLMRIGSHHAFEGPQRWKLILLVCEEIGKLAQADRALFEEGDALATLEARIARVAQHRETRKLLPTKRARKVRHG